MFTFITVAPSCLHIGVPDTQGSSRISANVARFFGSISSIRPIICLLSRGKRRRSLQGPFMTSGFFSPSVLDPLDPGATFRFDGCRTGGCGSGTASLAGVFKSLVDFDGAESAPLVMSVPGVGGDAKSLYELSVIRGIFQGNRRSDMQQKIMARDQISVGWGSYFLSS